MQWCSHVCFPEQRFAFKCLFCHNQIPTSTSVKQTATKSLKCSHLAEGFGGLRLVSFKAHSSYYIPKITGTPSKILYDTEHP